jgi:hypothetical protein
MLAFSVMKVESLYVGEARSQWKGNEPQVRIETEREREREGQTEGERERERMTSKTTTLGAAAQISAAPASGMWATFRQNVRLVHKTADEPTPRSEVRRCKWPFS